MNLATLPNLLVWLEPGVTGCFTDAGKTTPCTDGSACYVAADSSGNGLDATQPTSANRPTYKASGIGGMPGLLFDGSASFLTLGQPQALSGAQVTGSTRIYVLQSTSVPAVVGTLLSKGGDTQYAIYDSVSNYGGSGNFRFQRYASFTGDLDPQGVLQNATPYVIAFRTTPVGTSLAPAHLEEVFVNGLRTGVSTTTDRTLDSANDWNVGRSALRGFYFPGYLGAVAFFGESLGDADLRSAIQYFAGPRGIAVSFRPNDREPANPPVSLVLDGNSIAAGHYSQGSWLALVRRALNVPCRVNNVAIVGRTIANNTANLPNTLAPLIDRTLAANVALWQEITNSIQAGLDAATITSQIVTYCNDVLALGVKRVYVLSCIACSAFSSGQETIRQTVNGNLRTAGTLPAGCVLIDIGNSGTITVAGQTFDVSAVGAPGAASSGTYFADGLHPTHAGHAVIAAPVLAQLNQDLPALAVPRVPVTLSTAGVGAFAVTVTVTSDGATPILGAIARLTVAGESYYAASDASGQARFSVNSGTYTLSAVAAGYTYAPSSQPIDASGHWSNGTGTLTITMTAVSVTPGPAPGAPPLCTCSMTTLTAEGAVDAAQSIDFQILEGPGLAGFAWWTPQTVVSDSMGLLVINLPQGAKVQMTWGNGPSVTFTVPSTSTANLAELLGQ